MNKNLNLGHNFLTKRDRALILHMFIPCDKAFHIFDLVTLKFDLLLKNFNLSHNFLTKRATSYVRLEFNAVSATKAI